MRFTIMGAGALGCYFGARLAQTGHQVAFVGRGAHLAAMQAQGLRIESQMGDIHLPKVTAVADPTEAPPPEAVLFLVKNRDVESAAATLAPVLGPETLVITGQNGVTAPDRLASVIGAHRVVPGVVVMPADIRAPGVVRHAAPFHRLTIGRAGGAADPAVHALGEVIAETGVELTVSDDIDAVLWQKFVGLTTLAAMTALTRLDIGPLRASPQSRALLRQTLDESAAVARAACPGLTDAAIEEVWTMMVEVMPPHMHASMRDDLERGKPIELPYLSGEVSRRGAAQGIATPIHDLVTAALSPYIDGPPASPGPS